MRSDFLIVGAGFSGLIAAHQLTNAGYSCVVVDKRDHIGGNAHDQCDSNGVLYHKYGPHYFRSNSKRIVDFMSMFTEWHHVDYTIKSFTDNRYWSFPINLHTFEELIGRPSTESEFESWLAEKRIPIATPKNSEEVIISQIGRELYEKFFEGYTIKQWKRHPRDLDPSVCGRIPIRTNRDNRYLQESFQALPKDGYTRMFERMIDRSPHLVLLLGTEYREAMRFCDYGHLIFTGAIDEYYDYRFGELPYRSLRFEVESISEYQLSKRERNEGPPGFWQPAMQVNYPDASVPYTRIVEIKHATGQRIDATNIVREYPADWKRGDEPYYPIPAPDTAAAYARYAELANAEKRVSFIGRLATYRYYNMDQVAGMALATSSKLIGKLH